MFSAANSSEDLGDQIEIPIDPNTDSIIERLFWQYKDSPSHAQTIENISSVSSFHRQKNHKIWCNLYPIFCLVDEEILLKALKNKSPQETDYSLRAMILFKMACPTCLDDEEFWEDDTPPTPTEISNLLFKDLSLNSQYNDTELQQIKAFCSNIGSLLSRNWEEYGF
ncbi:hypothetical protein B4U84_29320 [Westiellopsis prolifica IICB1]|nr:hypothetical protein B4U84_29320 [Westiellopsis prolifica IICB1]